MIMAVYLNSILLKETLLITVTSKPGLSFMPLPRGSHGAGVGSSFPLSFSPADYCLGQTPSHLFRYEEACPRSRQF